MSASEATRSITLTATADLSAKQFYFGKITSSAPQGGVDVHSVAQAMPHGIIGEGVASGRQTNLILPGCVAQAVVGTGGVTVATKVAADSDGTLVAHGASNGNECCGIALETGVAGDIVSFYFAPLGQTNA